MKAVLRRIVKTSLSDADGKAINPVSAFSRVVCYPQSARSILAVARSLIAAAVVVSMAVDWGLIDPLVSYKRAPNDGDKIWFWFRPADWIHAFWLVTLIFGIISSGFKRIDSEEIVSAGAARVYCFMWTALTTLIPLSATSLIFYYAKVRYGHSFDPAFEATLVTVFASACLELLWGAWPAAWTDVILPLAMGCAFLLYTFTLARVWKLELYTELDWNGDPAAAGKNAAIFLAVLTTCAAFSTLIAMQRNRIFGRRANAYAPLGEKAPLKDPGLA